MSKPKKEKPPTQSGQKTDCCGIPVHCAHDAFADVAALQPNPKNPNRHGDKQIALLAKIIRHQGWRAPVVVSRRSGFVVSGHGRLQAAAVLKVEAVPVNYQDFATEADEWAHMIADNRIAELADMDNDALAEILRDLDGLDFDAELTGFNANEISKAINSIDVETVNDDSIGGKNSIFQLKHDVFFPSSNPDGIPDLIPEKIFSPSKEIETCTTVMDRNAEQCFWNWSNGRPAIMNPQKTILGFYTHDAKFEDVWFEAAPFAERLLSSKWKAIVTPNFSMLPNEPRILHKWNVYRSKWCGRFWQEIGFDVIPDVEWTDMQSLDYALVGIPEKPKCISIQVHTKIKNPEENRNRMDGIKEICSRLHPEKMIVYGASDELFQAISELVPEQQTIKVLSQNQAMRRKKTT